jgi:glycosyltransferase involved in cell wall biosynthesis
MKLTVCMAAYNGESYIEKQLRSILSQLGLNDNVIIINDHSTDRTLEIIDKIGDPRIHTIDNECNLGVIKSFEKSLSYASGDIVFLSDQDDLWMPGKVAEIVNVFKSNREITLVASDAMLIDEADKIIGDSFFAITGTFKSGWLQTLIQNKYLGCTLAFRQQMISYILPFPQDVPMHDIWIGIVNDLYGRSYYIDKPLIQYRRHTSNITSMKNYNIWKTLKYKIMLIKSIASLLKKQSVSI